jgi:hypothetical protein
MPLKSEAKRCHLSVLLSNSESINIKDRGHFEVEGVRIVFYCFIAALSVWITKHKEKESLANEEKLNSSGLLNGK